MCKRDGNEPAYMVSLGWLSDSLEGCCTNHFKWAYDVCMNGGAPVGPTDKYFADYLTGTCLQDCDPASSTGDCSPVPPPIVLYDSIETCCEMMPWVDVNYCWARSFDTYTDGWVADYEGVKCGKYLRIHVCIM